MMMMMMMMMRMMRMMMDDDRLCPFVCDYQSVIQTSLVPGGCRDECCGEISIRVFAE